MKARRSAKTVGATRRRLAKLIETTLNSAGMDAAVDPSRLWPAQGVWRIDCRLDVYRWSGQITIAGQTMLIDSWDPMVQCVKGFKIVRDRGAHFELHAGAEGFSYAPN